MAASRPPAPARAASTTPAASSLGTLQYAFVDNYAKGSINSLAVASTPTQRGVFVLPVLLKSVMTPTLTVLDTFRYSYDVTVTPGESLKFYAAKPAAIGIDALGFVELKSNGTTKRIFSEALPPVDGHGPNWHYFSYPLTSYVHQTITVTFGTDAVNGNPTAAWVSFARAGIYS